MNAAHLHLIVTHAPTFAVLFGCVLWLAGLVLHSLDFRRAALLLFVLAGALSAGAYFTGGPAAQPLMTMPGMNRDLLDQHQEVAVLAFVLTVVLGVAALAGLVAFRPPKPAPRWFAVLALVLALLAGGLLSWTSYLGGRARHSEIQPMTR